MKHKMESEKCKQLCVSGSRRTRSQAAPEWPVEAALILVNEIAAVEADCLNALSSYQMWNIIAANCTALDKPRTLNQCRRKWDSLVSEYNKIKQWELQSGSGLYWSLESERRRECGLPENFDSELFKAVDDLVRAQEKKSDTDSDSDPEAKIEVLDVAAELGSRRQRRRLTSPKICVEEKPLISYKKEEPPGSPTEEKPQKKLLEDPVNGLTEENPQESCFKEKYQKRHEEDHVEEKETMSIEEQEQMMIMKLHENAELIEAIVSENVDLGPAADVKNVEDCQTDFARRQGDKLIKCLRDIVNTLDQFSDLVQ
ncbi:trihelix transcription factor ASR3 [Corylus avellana]|uniref:trihelix transcription factor ASR3 n=1 Tax=Corylus avellana TaxID=13451 RepID=UPI001E20D22A|nr:trihelix transcription factor ASR3 [Corylus avellana]